MKKAILLARVSDTKQEAGFSLDAQRKLLRNYAPSLDIKIAMSFVFPETASRPMERKMFKEIMNFLKERTDVKIILVEKVDRLTRNFKDAVAINDWLSEDPERQVHFVKQSLVLHANSKSYEKFQWDIYVVLARQYSNNLSEETKKGLQEKFEQGEFPGWAPLGYVNKTINKKRIAIPDPERWHLVRKVLKMYLTGNYSALEISDILYKKGLTSKTGKRICNSIMINTLKNPFYAGLMKWNGQEKIGNHKKMITLSEHNQILTIMNSHNCHGSRRRKYNFLLRGFIFCDICGQRYTAEKHRAGKITDYYHCSARSGKHSSKGQNIPVEDLEKMVRERFKNIQFSKELISLTVEKIKKFYQERKAEDDQQKKILLNKKMSIERDRETAEKKLLKGVLADEDFVRIREGWRKMFDNIQDGLDELEKKHDIDIDTAREVLLFSRDVYKAYKLAPYEIKRLFLSFFWDRIWVRNKKIVRLQPTRLIDALLKEKKIIIRSNWLRG